MTENTPNAPLPDKTDPVPVPTTDIPADMPEDAVPARKEGIGCLSTFSYCLLLIGLAVLLSAFVILAANDMFALIQEDRDVRVVIEENYTLKEIADILADNELIRYPTLFWLFARMTDMDTTILPGEYDLNTSMDYRAILYKVKYKPRTQAVVTVTIPEGMTQADIFKMLESRGICDAYMLQAYAQYYAFSYHFIKDLPLTENRLEGYLFPDTYDFYVGDNPLHVLQRFLNNFNRKWDVDLRSRAENINMSVEELIIIASMIEREAKYDDERPAISAVIHNRLLDPAHFPLLQIDATVQYALGEWKEVLTEADTKIDSPYNTYLYPGLPIGPICNPGLAAIRAAAYPEEHSYYYYVARKNGYHYFASTYDAHLANIARAAAEDGTEVFAEAS